MHRSSPVLAALVLSFGLAACGSSEGNGGSSAESQDSSEVDGGADQATQGNSTEAAADEGEIEDGAIGEATDIGNEAIASTSDDAYATVVIDGVTTSYAPIQPGAADDFYSFCSTVAGSLQGVMQEVDESGERVEGGELSFILLEPGGAYESTGDPAELQINTSDFTSYSSFDGGEINVPASGSTASGDFTLGDVSGTIEVSC